MKVVKRSNKYFYKQARDMTIGEYGQIVDNGMYQDCIVLRTYSGLVDINEPTRTWPFYDEVPRNAPAFLVRLMEPVCPLEFTPIMRNE